MDGLSLMLKAFGIDTDSQDIKKSVDLAKVLIPQIAAGFDEMNQRLKRVDKAIDVLLQLNEFSNARIQLLSEKLDRLVRQNPAIFDEAQLTNSLLAPDCLTKNERANIEAMAALGL